MKVIFRADDLGFSEAVNLGILKVVQDGPIQNVGLMTNMPSAQHGFELLKLFNIALGQHTNISVGKPLSDPSKIQSLLDEKGEFCNSKVINSRPIDSILVEEAEIEIEAQLSKFKEICGKNPDYFEGHAVFSKNFFIALKNVAKRHGLFYCDPFEPQWRQDTQIQVATFQKPGPGGVYDIHKYLIEDEAKITGSDCALLIFHPGYIDQYLLDYSSYNLVRPMEVSFLTSDVCRQWLKEQNIQCVNFNTYR